MSTPRFDGVVFDLDGTLVDSRVAVLVAVATGIRVASAEAGIEAPPVDDAALRAALGLPAPEYFRAILPATLGHLAPRVKEASTRHEVEAFASGRGRLHPGVLETLDRLRAADLSIAVISNAQAPYFRAAIEHTGLGERLHHAECHEELPPSTPAPYKLALLRRALERLGLEPSRTLMVGDRRDDFEAGKATGCRTVAVSFGFGDGEELAGADERIDGFEELPARVGLVD
jgi:phosphoglycolate phosphatase